MVGARCREHAGSIGPENGCSETRSRPDTTEYRVEHLLNRDHCSVGDHSSDRVNGPRVPFDENADQFANTNLFDKGRIRIALATGQRSLLEPSLKSRRSFQQAFDAAW